MSVIKSVSYDQIEILKSIMTLCNIERFSADVTYGNGKFYDNDKIPEPLLKFDINPQVEGVCKACSSFLPVDADSIDSLVFDPPFLTYVKQAREHNSIMAKWFGGYWRYDELEEHYKKTIQEAARILRHKGIMVIKCQDIIHNHKMHCTHANVIGWASDFFRLKDLFVLPAKNRMSMPVKEGYKKRVQKHARVFHSYFLVLERNKVEI